MRLILQDYRPCGKGKRKGKGGFVIAPSDHTSKALRYGMHSQWISQFYLHTPRTSATEWTIPAFAFSAKAGTYLPTPGGWKAELALEGWLVTYRNKYPALGVENGHGRPSQYQPGPT